MKYSSNENKHRRGGGLMKSKDYIKISGILLGTVALLHSIRAFAAWPVNVGPYELPIWLSVAAVIILGNLSYASMNIKK